MSSKQPISIEQAHLVGTQLGLDWKKISPEQFRRGLQAELEHGQYHSETQVTVGYLVLMGKFVWAQLMIWDQLKETRDYYRRLDQARGDRQNVAFTD